MEAFLLSDSYREEKKKNNISKCFWEAFESTTFSSDEESEPSDLLEEDKTETLPAPQAERDSENDASHIVAANEEPVSLPHSEDEEIREDSEIEAEESGEKSEEENEEIHSASEAETFSEKSDDENGEFDEANEDEKRGECVGFDGESDRSEDEEMNDYDREFLDDSSENPNSAGSSHLALLNNSRFADDDLMLRR